jgi:hypothetical protein
VYNVAPHGRSKPANNRLPTTVDDPPRLRETARELLALDFDVLLEGDGQPILQSGKDRLRDLVDTFSRTGPLVG